MHKVTVLPQNRVLSANPGENLYQLLLRSGLSSAALCGGTGKCGKCLVTVDGVLMKSCETIITEDMIIELPDSAGIRILESGEEGPFTWNPPVPGYAAAVDLGTTTLCCYLLDKRDGREIHACSMVNPQRSAGADVLSRIRRATQGHMEEMTHMLRDAVGELLMECCRASNVKPEEINLIIPVGNPAMQQFFFGTSIENLIRIPFHPLLTRAELLEGTPYLPEFPNARIMAVPDISAYVGADTVACILSAGLHKTQKTVLLVDIGTNGEMVLRHRGRMLACAAAAGPALEGADISCGMTARPGAIDRVWTANGALHCHVVGDVSPEGICGSGIIDAAAAALELGLINNRGKLTAGPIVLAAGISLNQEDIRALQLAKGAICAGIEVLCLGMGISPREIDTVIYQQHTSP